MEAIELSEGQRFMLAAIIRCYNRKGDYVSQWDLAEFTGKNSGAARKQATILTAKGFCKEGRTSSPYCNDVTGWRPLVFSVPEAIKVRKDGRAVRKCMCCGKRFESEHKFNRLCDYCTRKG